MSEAMERAVAAGAEVIARSAGIDAPKLPAACWHGLAREVIEVALKSLDKGHVACVPGGSLIAELRAALKPFAEIAREIQPTLKDEHKISLVWAAPKVSDFRRALSAFNATSHIGEHETESKS